MTEPRWLTFEAVLALHAESITRFGGTEGIRDHGLLESALERPKMRVAYETAPSLADLAAAYCAGISRNHPFLDGNKRTAVLAAVAFLEVNGRVFRPPEAEIVHAIMTLAAGELEEATLARWFAVHSAPRQDEG